MIDGVVAKIACCFRIISSKLARRYHLASCSKNGSSPWTVGIQTLPKYLVGESYFVHTNIPFPKLSVAVIASKVVAHKFLKN
jgi:hypothetical protein